MSSGVFRAIPNVGVAERGTCKGCGAEIWWRRHEKTATPHPYNVDGVTHFATCFKADEFRSRKPKAKP